MKSLHTRLKALDEAKQDYWLDFVTLKSGFTYRHVAVSYHDEATIFGIPQMPEGPTPELYLQISEIASARIVKQ